jgi:hypothetical protein
VSPSNREIERIESAWDELGKVVGPLGADGLLITGSDGWTVKDHLAHIAAWEQSVSALFDGRDRPSAMGLPEPLREERVDALNNAIRKLHQEESAERVIRYFHETHAQLMRALGKLSDADLEKPYSHYQPTDPDENRPAVAWVAGNTYEHYAEHIGWINQMIKESSASR